MIYILWVCIINLIFYVVFDFLYFKKSNCSSSLSIGHLSTKSFYAFSQSSWQVSGIARHNNETGHWLLMLMLWLLVVMVLLLLRLLLLLMHVLQIKMPLFIAMGHDV